MSAPEQKEPEKKDIEYNEEQKKILENIEKQIAKIKEIENITIGENESLVNIKEHLEPIPERIRKLRSDLLEKLDALKKELKRLQDEHDNDDSLKNITEMIQTSIGEIDNLNNETVTLTTTKNQINDEIGKKADEARNEELPEADQKTKDLAKELDEATLNTKEESAEKKDDNEMSYEDTKMKDSSKSSGVNIYSPAPVDNSKVKPNLKKINLDPKYIEMDKANAKNEFGGKLDKETVIKQTEENMKEAKERKEANPDSPVSIRNEKKRKEGKSKITPGNELRLETREKQGISGRKPNPLTKKNRSQVLTKKTEEGNKGGKRTRKRRKRNSRKKKVVKRR